MVSPKRNIIVTGASRGLGRDIALAFGKAGDRVVMTYLNDGGSASESVSAIVRSGGDAHPVKADVRIASEMEAVVSMTAERWGAIDVVVNNAGITSDGLLMRMTEQEWDSVLKTNLTGPFHCMRAASRLMSENRTGHIINIASIAGVQGREGQANYAASKAALIGLTRAAAREFGPMNIQVNAILPGYLQTGMGQTVSETVFKTIVRNNVLKRSSEPSEIAAFVYHLSSMKHVSGQVFNLDSRIL